MDKSKSYNSNVDYEVIYRNVKYPRLEFKTGELILILPKNYQNHEDIIEKHKKWINEKKNFIERSLIESKDKKLVERNFKEFKLLACHLAGKISKELKLEINKIYFRKMKTKWGSCSSKKNLTLNTLLRYLPEDLVEYVIFHEIIHLIEKKHNERFWRIISGKFKNYQEMEKELFIYWFLLQTKVLKEKIKKVKKWPL